MAALVALSMAASAEGGQQARVLAQPATEVMVLGLGHLDGAAPGFQTTWLEPVLCWLRAFAPDVVLTEAMPGEQIMTLDAYKASDIEIASSATMLAQTPKGCAR